MRDSVSLHVRDASFGGRVGGRERSHGFYLLVNLVFGSAESGLEMGYLLGGVNCGRARFVQLELDGVALGPKH